MIDERKNCPMRHENGNCMSVGGFCLAVNDDICEGLRNAYKAGSLADKAENNWNTGTPTEEGWYLYEWGSTCGSYATYRADTKEELAYLKDANRWQKIEERKK